MSFVEPHLADYLTDALAGQPIDLTGLSVPDINTLFQQMQQHYRQAIQQPMTTNRTEQILNSISDGFYVLNREWHILYLNEKAAETWGMTRIQLLGRRIIDIFPSDYWEHPFTLAQRQAMQARVPTTATAYYDTRQKWYELRAYPFEEGISVYFTEVTEKKALEDALRTSEERFRMALKGSGVTVFQQDRDLRYTWKYEPERGDITAEVLGKTDAELFPYPEDAHSLTVYKQYVLNSGKGQQVEVSARNAAGEAVCYLLTIEPMRDETGAMVGISCAAVDITTQKQYAAALHTSEERFHVALKSSPIMVTHQDCDLHYTWGYAPQHGDTTRFIQGKTDLDLFKYPVEAQALIICKRQVIASGQGARLEIHTRDYKDDYHWYDVTIEPMRNPAGESIGITTVSIDITRLKEAEITAQNQRDQADALREVTLALSSTLHLEEILDRVMESIGRILPHDYTDIMLIHGEVAEVVRSKGYPPDIQQRYINHLQFVVAETANLHTMATTGHAYIVPDVQNDPGWVKFEWGTWLRSYAGIPILLQGKAIGFLNLSSQTVNFFDPAQIPVLEAFAAQVAIAVHNAELYQQAQELATYEERQRLARDLHDAVSQTLFSSSVLAESLLKLNTSKPERTPALLEQLYRLNRAAFAEMRALLLELRPATLLEIPIHDLIEQLANAAMGRKSFQIRLELDPTVQLPGDSRVTVYRIVQECLNNIVKHANAEHVTIRLQAAGDHLTLVVQDDGKGFDPAAVPPRALGMNILRERAQALNAQHTITSQPGQGTTIRLTWENS